MQSTSLRRDILRLTLVFLGLYFYHDILAPVGSMLNSTIELGLGCISLILLAAFGLSIVYTPARLIYLAWKSTTLRKKLVYAGLLLSFFILLFNSFKLSLLKDTLFYEMNKPYFEEITKIGANSKCYQSDSNCIEEVELRDELQALISQNDILTSSDISGFHKVVLRSRDNLYFVNIDNVALNHQNKLNNYYYNCVVKLGQHWFLCEIASGN